MKEQTRQRYEKVRALVDSGMSLYAALKQEKVSPSTYYGVHKTLKGETPKKRGPKPKQPYLDLPVSPAQSTTKLAVVIGPKDEILKMLDGLWN